MLIKTLNQCPEFTAGDESLLRELLHSDKEGLEIRYSLAHATVAPDKETRLHKLTASEVYYILKGEGEMSVDDEVATVRCGDAIYIPPHSTQKIRNTGEVDLQFVCIVDPAWQPQAEQVL